jgi:hypothetical protein
MPLMTSIHDRSQDIITSMSTVLAIRMPPPIWRRVVMGSGCRAVGEALCSFALQLCLLHAYGLSPGREPPGPTAS